MALDTHLVGDNVEDQNTSFSDIESKHRTAKAAHEPSLASVSQEKGGGRKRGRPAGRGTKNVKTAGNQAPRGRARAQVARKRPKICEYESDDDRDSQQIRPQGQDTREGGLDFNEKHLEPHETKKPENVQDTETVESSQQNEAFKPEDSKERECERMFVPEIEMTDRHNGHNSQVSEKLEILADPVQAMLFDMIPSLAPKNVEQPTASHREEKLPEVSNADSTTATTTKKKKVSYKAIAAELLKDW